MFINDANTYKIKRTLGNGQIHHPLPTLLHTTRIQSIAK